MTLDMTGPSAPGGAAPSARVVLPQPRTDTQAARAEHEPVPTVPGSDYRRSLPWRLVNRASTAIDHRIGWHRLPKPLGLAVLVGVRNVLRQSNLHDPQAVVPVVDPPPVEPPRPEHRTSRTHDGSYNDLAVPRAGMAGTRFGRNIPLSAVRAVTPEELLTPNPREVSRRLLTRTTFQPATSVNTLAAAWLQFMILDWFSHGEGDPERSVEVPLPPGDSWHESPMRIPRILPDPTRPEGHPGPVTSVNKLSHWWDGSSLYGNSLEEQRRVRTGVDGKLHLTDDQQVPLPEDPALDPTMRPGWWVGLGMLGTLFVREHNAVCDRLRAEYPDWSDEELFQRARLVVSALLAKIHTVEWTPAIISHPTTVTGLRANWFGLAGETIARAFGRISGSEVVSGIPGAVTEHYGVPYSLTEEFTSVYRMHPLLPDDFELRGVEADQPLEQRTFRELAGPASRGVFERVAMGDLFYSFGVSHPGAIVLRNYPRFLQEFERPDGKVVDLASTDVLRVRELGVPRYNAFRRHLHLQPVASFAELTDDPELAAELAEVYGGDVEQIDLMVGMFAEQRPEGFAFSDTAFRIFVLMASRRLNSDRFFTEDYTPEVYTATGLAWVRDNDMTSVLLRHYPQLRPALRGVRNAFAPWSRTA